MPARGKPLSRRDGPLARFAVELRRLRDQAPAGRSTSVDQVVKAVAETGTHVSRAAIFSALAGRTLPSRETLAVMVTAWSPAGAGALGAWNERRSECEHELAAEAEGHQLPTAEVEAAGRLEERNRIGGPEFGTVMRNLRIAAGLSLGEVSRRINYSKGQLSKVENGYKRPSAQMARLLDDVLGTGSQLSGLMPFPAENNR